MEQFLTGICARFGVRKKRIAADALDLLMAYEWRRNNVRELRNVVERMMIATDGELIGPEQVPREIRERGESPASRSGAELPGAQGGGGAADPGLRAGAERVARHPDGPGRWAWPTTRACSRSCAGMTFGGLASDVSD